MTRSARCSLLMRSAVFAVAAAIPAFALQTQTVLAQANSSTVAPSSVSRWHLLSTPGPDGVIHSIMHTAEPLKSDPDFAGMIVRCSAKLGLQVGFVLIVPLQPRVTPQVKLDLPNGRSLQLSATVLPPGTIALIASEAEPLHSILTFTSGELKITLQTDQTFRGIVPLDDFRAALASLRSHCL